MRADAYGAALLVAAVLRLALEADGIPTRLLLMASLWTAGLLMVASGREGSVEIFATLRLRQLPVRPDSLLPPALLTPSF